MAQQTRNFEVVEAGSKSSKGTSKTTVIAIDGGSGGAVPHPVPVPWPVVHCHHHHHHLKYVPKPVMVHHWVKKFKYGPGELSASNVHDTKHLMPTMIHEHEIPVAVPDSHGPQPIEEVKMHVNGLDSTYDQDASSMKLKAEASNYGDLTMQGNSTETIDTGKPNHPFLGLHDQDLDESRVSVNRNPAMNLIGAQLRAANEIEQTKARKILERILKEQSVRLTNIHRDNQGPLHLRGRHALTQAESRSVELMSKLASQRANYEARRLISRMTERSKTNNKARQAVSSNYSDTGTFSAIRNLFGFGSSGSGRNRLSRASIKSPSKQWHVPLGDPLHFSASSVRGRVVAPPPTSSKQDIEPHSLMNNLTKSSADSFESSPYYSLPDVSSYGFSESFGSATHLNPPELFRRVPSASGVSNNNKTRIPTWNEPESYNNLRRPDELAPDDSLTLIPSYLEFPATPELWSEQALKSINNANNWLKFHQQAPTESLNLFGDPMTSSSDWTSPSLADLNELFELSAKNTAKGVKNTQIDGTSMDQFEAAPSGSMVNQQSSSFQSFDSLRSPLTGGARYLTSGTQPQSQFGAPSISSKPNPALYDSSIPLDTSNSLPEPLMESSNELNQMRQFQNLLSQPIANNLTGMVRLSGELRNPMRTLGAAQGAQVPSVPNIPSPPNIPMPGLPAPGMLLQVAGLALPFALARAQRQGNRNNPPPVSSSNVPRQRLLTRAVNSVTRRRPRPAQSPNSSLFSRLTAPQSNRLKNFMQTVRDMRQPSRSKPRTRIRPKMDAAKGRKTRVGRAMEIWMTEQRHALPLDAIPLVVQTDGSLSRFVPVTSPLGELEREHSRRQVAQQVDSFIPPQETLNRSALYELHAVPSKQVAHTDSGSGQLSNHRINSNVTPSNFRTEAASRRESSHEKLVSRPRVVPESSTSLIPEDLSEVESESQQFGQRQISSKGNQSAQQRIVQDSARKIADQSTTESHSFPTTSSLPPSPTTQPPTTGSTSESPSPTGRSSQMKPAGYVHALRLVKGFAHARLSPAHSGPTQKVS